MLSQRDSAPFGAACSDGGDWYACSDGPRFVGCCSSNACTDRGCSTQDVRPATYDRSQFGEFPDQDCTQGQWFVCQASNPPFMGCCTSNACGQNGCPSADLRAGSLSHNETAASAFLPSSTSSVSSTSSSTSTATASASPSATSAGTSGSSATPKIAGGIAGGVAVLVLIIAILLWRWRKYIHASRRATQDQQDYRLISGMKGTDTSTSYRNSFAPTGGTLSTQTRSFEYPRSTFEPMKTATATHVAPIPNTAMTSPPSSYGQPSRETSPHRHPGEWTNPNRNYYQPQAQPQYQAYSSRPRAADGGLLSSYYQDNGYSQVASHEPMDDRHLTELAAANENSRF